MSGCVCNGLGVYVDGDDHSEQLRVCLCDAHPLAIGKDESADGIAGARVDECLDAIANIRDLLWPGGQHDSSWSPDTIEAVARQLAFLRPQETADEERAMQGQAMASFRVNWKIDLDGSDAISAARAARRWQLDPDAQVGAFEVTDKEGRTVNVDLDEAGYGVREGLSGFTIGGIRQIEDEDALLGVVYIFGVMHHAWFVRVEDTDDDQVATNDPCDRLAEFHQLDADAGRLRTVTVPGFPGDYVLVIYPAGQ
jgi:hypothetical protein